MFILKLLDAFNKNSSARIKHKFIAKSHECPDCKSKTFNVVEHNGIRTSVCEKLWYDLENRDCIGRSIYDFKV